jgi:hypothetical protein
VRPQSAKAKGRRLQQEVRDAILNAFSAQLQPDDVRSTSMGASGEDILLSPAAREAFPFYTEAKNRESLNIWKAIEQTEKGAKGHIPLVVFRRNNTKIYAALPFNILLGLLQKAYSYDHP